MISTIARLLLIGYASGVVIFGILGLLLSLKHKRNLSIPIYRDILLRITSTLWIAFTWPFIVSDTVKEALKYARRRNSKL